MVRHEHLGWGERLGEGAARAKVWRQAMSYANKKIAFPTSLLSFCLSGTSSFSLTLAKLQRVAAHLPLHTGPPRRGSACFKSA